MRNLHLTTDDQLLQDEAIAASRVAAYGCLVPAWLSGERA